MWVWSLGDFRDLENQYTFRVYPTHTKLFFSPRNYNNRYLSTSSKVETKILTSQKLKEMGYVVKGERKEGEKG